MRQSVFRPRTLFCRTLLLGLALLPGCASLEALRKVDPQAGDFPSSLAAEYLSYAESESEQGDWRTAERFSAKGLAASRGETPLPEQPGAWKLPDATRADLEEARSRLIAAQNCGAISVVPQQAARAQLLFDCWVEKAARGHPDAPGTSCAEAFALALADVEDAVQPLRKLKEERNPHKPKRYTLYFESGGAAIGRRGQTSVEAIAAAAASLSDYKIRIVGHADAAGNRRHNRQVSLARAKSVKRALVQAGVPAERISVAAAGERKSAGAHRQSDRRAVVVVDPSE